MATADGTWAYRDRFGEEFGRTYFRRFGDGVVSSLGLGTYLGEPTDAVDAEYEAAITAALENGCNVLDTAINYRHQRSERVVGRALAETDVEREAVLVATKGGFLPFDGERPADPGEYVREEYVESGIVSREELVRGSHCIAPEFIDDQFDRSLSNLGVETIDLYYVHNPETQLEERSREAVYDRLEETFTRLEERVAAGDLRYYGVATWDAFRVHPEHAKYLSLPEVASRARAAAKGAGNTATHLRAIQLPFNVHMADAFTVEAHDGAAGPESALWFAQNAGLNVVASASLGQGQLVEGVPESIAERLEGESPVQKAINFARSAPGVTSALVGTRSVEHVRTNLEACGFDPMGADAFDRVFE
ncbi:aldo/keto reductase [Halalkalicoccus jeotgali]|uniref:Aldo/keto reductase n=1 Tax=Halalkalicoccus jeotgali (strain DSM 18796 / CECT 7217 / JCM 14584 / KCTC 4019 / B3) TaxID=795797 RepID=D8J8G8_HALJB|nr:aldo/keto reductase [Halalkalicoccus jeotgali]ADJ16214.1 aldo/keto reductase [Halalkalicoccus jeotgali B3]ELY37288.1 aldo/keto reductase [Halalkalicoccus jeotgali B3]